MGSYLWGFCKTDITAPIGMWQEGYGNRTEASTGIHSPIYARVAVVRTDSQTKPINKTDLYSAYETGAVALIVCDLIGFGVPMSDRIRNEVAKTLGIPYEAVLISCTHTHAGQYTDIVEARKTEAVWPEVLRQMDLLTEKVVKACKEAYDGAVPADFDVVSGKIRMANNRRQKLYGEKKAPIDDNFRLLRVVGKDGRPLCYLMQGAAHPTNVNGQNTLYSSEFCGAACANIEETGVFALYFNGGNGDLSPYRPEGVDSWSNIAVLGKTVSDRALELAAQPFKPFPYGPLRAAAGSFPIPQTALSEDEIQKSLLGLRMAPGDSPESATIKFAIKHYERLLAAGYTNDTVPPKMSPLQVLLLPGSAAFLTFPYETFSETTLAAAEQAEGLGVPSPAVFTVGYCNGDLGYMPTAFAIPYGGYEVDISPVLYSGDGRWAPDAEVRARENLMAMLSDLLGAK